jgi:hypothetical protein
MKLLDNQRMEANNIMNWEAFFELGTALAEIINSRDN